MIAEDEGRNPGIEDPVGVERDQWVQDLQHGGAGAECRRS